MEARLHVCIFRHASTGSPVLRFHGNDGAKLSVCTRKTGASDAEPWCPWCVWVKEVQLCVLAPSPSKRVQRDDVYLFWLLRLKNTILEALCPLPLNVSACLTRKLNLSCFPDNAEPIVFTLLTFFHLPISSFTFVFQIFPLLSFSFYSRLSLPLHFKRSTPHCAILARRSCLGKKEDKFGVLLRLI